MAGFLICHYTCQYTSCILSETGGILAGLWKVCLRNFTVAAGFLLSKVTCQYTVRIYMLFADPKPVNNIFIFFQAFKRKKTQKKTRASVTVTVVRDRKIRTALRTNQIAGFVTVPAWKKHKVKYYMHCFYYFINTPHIPSQPTSHYIFVGDL